MDRPCLRTPTDPRIPASNRIGAELGRRTDGADLDCAARARCGNRHRNYIRDLIGLGCGLGASTGRVVLGGSWPTSPGAITFFLIRRSIAALASASALSRLGSVTIPVSTALPPAPSNTNHRQTTPFWRGYGLTRYRYWRRSIARTYCGSDELPIIQKNAPPGGARSEPMRNVPC